MHPLQAYEYLYKRRHETALNKVIIVEDEELLEPLFREILQHIHCPVYVLTDAPADPDSYKEKTDLYHFMTSLDEAEFVGWRIKDLLAGGTPSTDIGVVCADRACKEVLDAVFKRMDIAGEQQLPLASNGYYRLVKMLFALIYRAEGASFSAEALFADDKSEFKLGKGYYALRKILSRQGLKLRFAPAEALSAGIAEFTAAKKDDPAYEKDIAALTALKALSEKKPSVSEIAEAALRAP